MGSILLAIAVAWCIYRMRRYPLAKGLRLLAPVFLPSFMLARPLLRLANAFLRHAPMPKVLAGLSAQEGIADTVPYILYRPEAVPAPPLLIYIHGGGFFYEADSGLYRLCMEYALGAGCAVMVIRYRTSDRYPYPAQDDDCRTALLYAIREGGRLGMDTSRIAAGGDSAGGCLAASLAQWAADEGIRLRFQFLVYPVLDRRMQTESMKRFQDSPIWNGKLTRRMWEILKADASPAERGDLAGLPPAYVEVEEYDSLRDEGTEYAMRLRAAGVPVSYHFVHGSCHGFDEFFHNPVSERMVKERISYIKESFGPE